MLNYEPPGGFCIGCGLDLARLIAAAQGVPQFAKSEAPAVVSRSAKKRRPRPKRTRRVRGKVEPVTGPDDPRLAVPRVKPSVILPTNIDVATARSGMSQQPVAPPASWNGTLHGEVAEETIVSPVAPPAATWLLEFESGEAFELVSRDIVIGRAPVATFDATAIAVRDTTKSMSRTHARMRFDATRDRWTIEDLHSGNGVAVLDDANEWTFIRPGDIAYATYGLLFGQLRARLHRVPST